MAEGRDIDETQSYRVDLLFLAFIVISLLFGRLMKFLQHNMKGTTRRGLRHTVHHIEEELLALGLISLLLIVAEEYLLKICVDYDDDEKKKDDDSHSEKESDDGYVSDEEDPHHRRLLAGDAEGGSGGCPAGKEPFWSAQMIHQTHIFIFLIAIIHVLYATASFLLCLWRMRRWRLYQHQPASDLSAIKNATLIYGRNSFEYWFWSFWAQFSPSVDESLYVAMRYLFIERMELPYDFNFHLFLVNSLVEEFGIVIHAEWEMWVMVAVWILVPKLLLVTTILSVIVVLVVGTKLELVGVMLSQQAFLSYGQRTIVKAQSITAPTSILRKPIQIIGDRLNRISSSEKESSGPPKLATKSLNVFPKTEIDVSEGLTRRAHSFHQKEKVGGRAGVDNRPSQRELLENAQEGTSSTQTQEIQIEVDDKEEQTAIQESAKCFSRKNRGKSIHKSFSSKYLLPDSATLFWFGRPQLILRALQFVYFETAMAIALVCFDLWQSSDFILEDNVFLGSDYLLVVILIIVGILCLLQISFLMLPTYALTMVAGSHCPESVLNHAKKLNIQTAAVSKLEFLRNKSVFQRLNTLDRMPAEDNHNHNHNHHGEEASTSTALLVGAMYKGQMERMRQASLEMETPSGSLVDQQDPSIREEDEHDEEMKAIVEVFGSFDSFLAALQASQNAIKTTCPSAVFNFDCSVGSYNGNESTPHDAAAIHLTLDLKAATEENTTIQDI